MLSPFIFYQKSPVSHQKSPTFNPPRSIILHSIDRKPYILCWQHSYAIKRALHHIKRALYSTPRSIIQHSMNGRPFIRTNKPYIVSTKPYIPEC